MTSSAASCKYDTSRNLAFCSRVSANEVHYDDNGEVETVVAHHDANIGVGAGATDGEEGFIVAVRSRLNAKLTDG